MCHAINKIDLSRLRLKPCNQALLTQIERKTTDFMSEHFDTIFLFSCFFRSFCVEKII